MVARSRLIAGRTIFILMEDGIDFRQSLINFRQDGIDFSDGGINFREGDNNFRQTLKPKTFF